MLRTSRPVHSILSDKNPLVSCTHLKCSLPQKVLDLAHMVALDHNMPSRPVNHNLLVRQPQKRPKLVPQHLRLSINLLHPRHGLVAARFPQRVDGQVVAGRSGNEVGQIGRAELRCEGWDGVWDEFLDGRLVVGCAAGWVVALDFGEVCAVRGFGLFGSGEGFGVAGRVGVGSGAGGDEVAVWRGWLGRCICIVDIDSRTLFDLEKTWCAGGEVHELADGRWAREAHWAQEGHGGCHGGHGECKARDAMLGAVK